MITPDYVRLMTRYNEWQNQGLFGAADGLPDTERRRERGAFFGSIEKTLNHLLWADRMWLHRFTGSPPPKAEGIAQSTAEAPDWPALWRDRRALDAAILAWAAYLQPADLEGDFAWFSRATGRHRSEPRGLLIVHMFNHQTHHRGQVHAMLTAAGATPPDTDLAFMPGQGPAQPEPPGVQNG